MTTRLCYIDTETTGLDIFTHQPYELCLWFGDEEAPRVFDLPHTLDGADEMSLDIGGYHKRGFEPWDGGRYRSFLLGLLEGVTLVASNPAFDAGMMQKFLGSAPWHHRMIDVANVAMMVLETDRPLGMSEIRERLTLTGFDIPAPDHTAEGDVRCLRAAYEALRELNRMPL